MLILLFGLLLFNNSAQSFSNGLKWKQAYLKSEKEEAGYLKEYTAIYDELKHDRSFLLNYGAILYKSKCFENCIKHYIRHEKECISSKMYMMLADSYEQCKDYKKAEEHFLNASYCIPHLFVPKYHLFKIYCETEQEHKAHQMASEISKMKIKVFSDEVKNIKTKVNKYLHAQY